MAGHRVHDDIGEILFSEEEIRAIVARLGREISSDYSYIDGVEHKLILVCILKGSVVFMGELMKNLTIPVEIDFMRVSSYKGTYPDGEPTETLTLERDDIRNSDILIVEDIIDTGNTLNWLVNKRFPEKYQPRSVKSVTLLDKPSRRLPGLENFKADYTGAKIEDKFVVGYGLDYNQKYRALGYVGVPKPEVIA